MQNMKFKWKILLLLILSVALISGCQKSGGGSSSSGGGTTTEENGDGGGTGGGTTPSSTQISEFSYTTEVETGSNSTLTVGSVADQHEILFYEIQADGGENHFKPMAGIITSKETLGKLVSTYNAPTVPGTYAYTFTVRNSKNVVSERNFSITVKTP